jgi:hypothetical protein
MTEQMQSASTAGAGASRTHRSWRDDALSALVWASTFIWTGLVLLASERGLLGGLRARTVAVPAWALIFVGAAVGVLVETIVLLFVPRYQRPARSGFLYAILFVVLGLGSMAAWNPVWGVVFILVGLVIFLGSLTRH